MTAEYSGDGVEPDLSDESKCAVGGMAVASISTLCACVVITAIMKLLGFNFKESAFVNAFVITMSSVLYHVYLDAYCEAEAVRIAIDVVYFTFILFTCGFILTSFYN